MGYVAAFNGFDAVNLDTGAVLWSVPTENVVGVNLKVEVSEDRLYLARSHAGLAIYGLTAAGSVELLAEHATDGAVRNVHVEGHTAYLAINGSDEADVRFWDVSDATAPKELGTHAQSSGTSSDGLAVTEGYVYLGLASDLVVLDATCPQPETCNAGGQCTP